MIKENFIVKCLSKYYHFKLERLNSNLDRKGSNLLSKRISERNRFQYFNNFEVPKINISLNFEEINEKYVPLILSYRFPKEFFQKSKEFKSNILYFANLYHESIQEMIEGQREVMHNHKTILPNGEKVEERLQRFEEFLKSISSHLIRNRSKNNE